MIYFIQGALTKLIKIGRAVDCDKRLKDLQTGSPDKLHLLKEFYTVSRHGNLYTSPDDDIAAEKLLHDRFRFCWNHGEWYRPNEKLLEVIETIPLKMSKSDLAMLLDKKKILDDGYNIYIESRIVDSMGPGTALNTKKYRRAIPKKGEFDPPSPFDGSSLGKGSHK